MDFRIDLIKYGIETRFIRDIKYNNKSVIFKYGRKLYEFKKNTLTEITDGKNKIISVRKKETNIIVKDESFEKIPPKEPGLTIFITAYKSHKWIEECLNSIYNQSWFKNNDNWEVLIGVDGCYDTLNVLKKIKNNYKNIRIFMMNSNRGTYVTSNTLMELGKYQYYLRFDSDDIMKPTMVETLMNNSKGYDMIRFKFTGFKKNINENIKISWYSHGILFFDSKILSRLGGYDNVLCGADTYFIKRAQRIYNVKLLNQVLSYVRKHNDSLTKNKKTGGGSIIRRNAIQLMEQNYKTKNYIQRVTNTYTEIES